MIVHPLAEAMRRALGLDTTTEENRTHNTISGWTFASAFEPPGSAAEKACSLDIAHPANPGCCVYCDGPIPHKEP